MPGKKTTNGKQKSRSSSTMLLIAGLVCLVIVGIIFFLKPHSTRQPHVRKDSKQAQINPADFPLLIDAAVWYPSAPWAQPEKAMARTAYGDLTGGSIRAIVTGEQASISHFEDSNALARKGFLPDNTLSADGPGSSVWGYKKQEGNTGQVLMFSYRTRPTSTNPNEPLQFTCPCKIDVTVFESTPFTP